MIDLKEVSLEIRDIILKKQKSLGLTFTEDNHEYWMNDLNGKPRNDYFSVSKIIEKLHEKFPANEKSLKKANGDLEVQKQILKEWADAGLYSINIGSRTHYYLEDSLIDQYGKYKTIRKPIFECDEYQESISNSMIDAGNKFIELMHQRGAVLLDTEMVLGDNELGYVGQPDKFWLMLNKTNEVGLVISDWKGLPLDTPILTDSGWKTMDTLTNSDKVYDKDGILVNILNISNVKNVKCLKIIFDNNEEIVSDFEHRWLVFTEKNNVKKEVVMTTQEIKDYYDGLTTVYSDKVLKIENPKPLVNEGSDTLISYNQRLFFLRNKMDSKGVFDKRKKRFILKCDRKKEVEYYSELLSTLGVKTTISKYYEIEFITNKFNPFSDINNDLKDEIKDKHRIIVSVEEVESVPTKCIEVDSLTSTYLCGKQLLVTHNTNKPKNFEVQFYTKKMFSPFEKYVDTSLTHYYIQLILYVRLLIKMLKGSKYENMKVFGGVVVLLKEDGTFQEYKIPKDISDIVYSLSPILFKNPNASTNN